MSTTAAACNADAIGAVLTVEARVALAVRLAQSRAATQVTFFTYCGCRRHSG